MSATTLPTTRPVSCSKVRGGTVYVIDIIREHLEYPALKRRVIDVHQHWKNLVNGYALLIENKGSGMSLIQDLKQDHIHALAVDPVRDKVMRNG